MTLWKNLVVTLVAAFALAACSSSDDPAPVAMPDPEPTPQETCEDGGGQWADGMCLSAAEVAYNSALAAIAAAATAEDAQAAYDAVKDDVSATQGDALQMAVDTRIAALATMDRQDMQTQALMDAAGMIDTSDLSTQALVDAARTAIAGLRQAIADAVDVDDTSMYQTTLDDAVMAVDDAQGGIDTATRRMNQMDALSSASMTLQAALTALSGSTPTQAQLDAANNALTALNAAITGGADLTDTEKAPYQREANNAAPPIQTAQTAFDDAEDEADKAAAVAMAALAAKLHAGISAPTATDDDTADTATATGTRFAGYVTTAGTPTGASVGDIVVGISDNADVALSEDEDTTVAANNDWEGKRYHRTTPASEGTYEAYVYSHVGDPTEGDKFGQIGVTTAGTGYEYGLDADGFLTETVTEGTSSRIASPSFDHSAGVKTFELGTNNVYVSISGTYHGVSGEYRCTPGANTCAAQVAGEGFNLGGVTDADPPVFADANATWIFKPTNPEARVMSTPDDSYGSYGWWLHTAANGDLTASAFVDRRGAAAAAVGLNTLNGTATYVGGAVGQYALSSTTGGTNDAGSFTARATLEANFTRASGDAVDDAITGTIDMFVGADGESRDWTVKLSGSPITDGGVIGEATATDGTEWTIGGTAAADSGSWTGSLQENGDDGVPAIATGTFYTEYGTAGKMVGAFGANKQ